MSRALALSPDHRVVLRIRLVAAALACACLLGVGWARAQSPPGKGIADPKQWGTDWAKNQAKDGIFGKDVTADFDAIFKQLPDSIANVPKQAGPCAPRALSEAWWAADELSHKRVLQGAGKTLFDILDDLVGLGSKELGEFLAGKAEGQIRKWLAGKLAGQKPRGYEATLGNPECSLHTITSWDPAAQSYRFTVIGTCHCRPVPLMGQGTYPVKAFLVVLEGPAKVEPSKDRTKLELHPGPAHLVHLSADCACDAQHASDAAQLTLPGPKKATSTGGQTGAKPKPVPAPAEGCAAADCRKDLDFLKELDGRTDLDTARWSLAIDRICDHWNECKCGDKLFKFMSDHAEWRKLFAKYCVNLEHHHAKDRRTGYVVPGGGEGEPVSDTGGAGEESTEIAAGEAGAVELRVGAPGQERPGTAVDFYGEGGRVVRKVTDATGTVRLTLAEGRYEVVVGGGGEPVRGTVEVEAGKLASMTADSGGVSSSGSPLSTEVRPADAVAEKGYDISYREEYDLFTIEINTPEGKVYVSAPEAAEEDTPVSWGVTPVAGGGSPRQVAKNASKLQRYSVIVDDRDRDADLSSFDTMQLTATPSAKIALKRGDKTMVQGTVPFRMVSEPPAASGTGEGSGTVLAGGAFGLPGHFDGDASNTRLTVGSKPLRVAAESTLAVFFYTPADAIGPLEVVAEDGGVTVTGTVNNLGLRFWADQTDLLRGQRTTCHVRVSGLEGLERPVYLALVNRTPGIISLSPADAQLLVLAPGGAGTPGTFQADRPMVGVTPGGFVITAAVTEP